ncbi:MAG: adenylate/guanylate cyclase domain-containing protein [Pseudomonadota bacterium]|nr:adenylate/guanylate cyclase domain-containing protein [Pseudomonadota bacterium]
MRYRRWLAVLLGPRTTKKLPSQVAAAIEEQENRGEVLVKLIQLIIVAVWGFLFLIAPRVKDGEPIAIIPYAIGIYLVVNAIGLLWATRRRLPNWSVYFSIVFDMVLLYVVIWRFHVLMDQPPAFYLKVPTLAFVFVFIALRALRFQPSFVLVAGGAAALGWIIMVAYSLLGDPDGAVIARNYVDYATGNTVLPGAELEKLSAMLLVTGILALSLYRGRALLIRATTETVAAKRLSRFFDSSVAEDIRAGEVAPGEGLAREAAILNVDIRGFSAMVADIPPSDAIAVLAAYQRRVVPIIQAHGGAIDKFMGDGIMATFGAVRPSESYAADALRAMEAILNDLRSWNEDHNLAPLARRGIGIAISAGPIVFGAVGDRDRLEVTVIGAMVNLSAKLEKANKVLSSESIATRLAFDTALVQGYVPERTPEFIEASVEGVAEHTALAIWGRKKA